MKRIEVKFSLPVVEPLLELIIRLCSDSTGRPATPAAPQTPDADLHEIWSQELLRQQSADLAVLGRLFDSRFLADGMVCFDSRNAESVIRACSSVRLRLRETALKPLSDDQMESSDQIDRESLDDSARKALACYMFLATIQELVIEHLEEGILGGEEMD